MASANIGESEDGLNYYQLLGVEQDASNEAIIQAFRRLSKQKHPDKNLNDRESATRDYQNLTHAKIILLDSEKRRKHDEDLIDSGVRNEKALPLYCSICWKERGRNAHRCLKGFGHKNPIIEDFYAAQREHNARRYSQQSKQREKADFIKCLERVLRAFVKNDFPKLYPLVRASNLKNKTSAGNLGQDLPLPSFVNDNLKQCYVSMREETSDEPEASSLPTASEVAKLLQACQTTPSRRRHSANLSSTDKFPMYDLSALSDEELRLTLEYLRLPYETFASREVLENLAHRYCPMVALLPNLGKQSFNRSKKCGRCSSQLSLIETYFRTSRVCFSCNKVCCGDCLMATNWKIPSSGSFDLRTICSECCRISKIYESQSWLERGIALLEYDQSRTETVLAMYRISNAVRPSDVAVIQQAKLLYDQKKYTTLVGFGKEILLSESMLTKDNSTVLLYLVVESQLQVVGAMPDTDLMSEVELCEDAVEWIERFSSLVDKKTRNVKLKAIQMRLDLLRQRDETIKKKAAIIFSQLIQAIREGSFLKALLVIEDEDEDSNKVMHLCWKKLLGETNENYNEYSRLISRLLKATALHKQGNSTAAITEVADVFWGGYEHFQLRQCSIPIVDYVVQFTLRLIMDEASLPLEDVAGISVSNFLSTLQLTEQDLINPPDIDDRKWGNLTVEGCDMKMFLKYETAVKKLVEKKKWTPLDAAFAYYDLLNACQHPAQLLLTIITSAQWFTRQISCSDSTESCLFACKKMITKLTNLAAALAFQFSTQPYMRYYVAKMVIALQFYSSLKTGYEGHETANFIGVHLKWLVATGRHCPLHKMPIVTPTEAVLLNIISTKLHCEYLLKLQDVIPAKLRPMSEAILRYQNYENWWFKRGGIVDPTDGGLRLTAMATLLAERKWSWDEVQRRLVSNMIALDRNGWQIVNGKLMDTVSSSKIQRIVGLEIDKKDFSIKVLVEQSSRWNPLNRKPALLSWGDIAGGLSLSQAGAFFSLEAIDPQETPYHPFNKLIYSPEELEGTEMLFTMLHTDYLLKQFSMGHEIQSCPPFQLRPVSDGLFKDLPNYLKEVLRSISSRGASRHRVHRLWIQADTMEYDVQETGDTIRWLFGEVKITVRCMPMFHGEDGELKDLDTGGPDPDSPEGRFVEDFTNNYENIGKHFPAFLRLKELCKVQWLGQFLDSFKHSMEDSKKRIKRGELDSEIRHNQTSALQKAEASIASNLDKIRNDIKRQVSYIDDNVVRQVHEQGGISASYSQISNWLYTGNLRDIAKKIAQENAPSLNEIRREMVEQQKENLQKFTSTIEDLRRSSKKFLSPSNRCQWIPAVNYRHDEDGFTRFHYGGVSLTPKAVKTNLSTSRFFSGISKVALTPGLLSNYTPKKQPTPPAFNPSIINATKPSTTMQQTSQKGDHGHSGGGGGGGGNSEGGGGGPPPPRSPPSSPPPDGNSSSGNSSSGNSSSESGNNQARGRSISEKGRRRRKRRRRKRKNGNSNDEGAKSEEGENSGGRNSESGKIGGRWNSAGGGGGRGKSGGRGGRSGDEKSVNGGGNSRGGKSAGGNKGSGNSVGEDEGTRGSNSGDEGNGSGGGNSGGEGEGSEGGGNSGDEGDGSGGGNSGDEGDGSGGGNSGGEGSGGENSEGESEGSGERKEDGCRSGGDSLKRVLRALEKACGTTMGSPLRMDKKSPKARQYVKPLYSGKSDWETALLEYNTAIGRDAEVRAGKTAQASGWDTLKSSLEKVQRGEKPPRGFSLVHTMTVEGQEWWVSVRSSSEDKRPTMEFYRKGVKGKMAEKRIKIRFGGKQSDF